MAPDLPPFAEPVLYLVEDDYDWSYFFREIFQRMAPHWKIISARDGLEAQKLLASGPMPHVLITDLHMPGMNGIELIEWLRSQARFQSLSIHVLSGSADPSHRQKCALLGVDGYFEKPASLRELRKAIQYILDECEKSRSGPVSAGPAREMAFRSKSSSARTATAE